MPSAGYLPMQALQVALVLRIVESLQILRMKGPGAEILGVFSNNFVSLDVLYKIKNYRVSFVPDPNKTIDLFCKNQHLWAKFMGKIVLWRHPYNNWPENFAPWSKYMANRPPRGRFIQGFYKPMQGKCAIYFCPGVRIRFSDIQSRFSLLQAVKNIQGNFSNAAQHDPTFSWLVHSRFAGFKDF